MLDFETFVQKITLEKMAHILSMFLTVNSYKESISK